MTRKKFRLILIAFIMVSVSILTGFMVTNLNGRGGISDGGNQAEVIGEGVVDEYEKEDYLKENRLEFYVNDSSARKTKIYSQETVMLVIEIKLFITNNDSKRVLVDPDAIDIAYDTNKQCKLYEIDYGNIEKPISIESKETASISFEIKLFINDTENFRDCIKRELKFNYKSEQIYVCMV